MPQTTIGGKQIRDASVQRSDLDVLTPGQAVVRKIIQGAGVSIISTGADSGTGDVTISASGGGGTSIKQVELDFGTSPTACKSFTVIDSSILSTSKIIAQQAGDAPTGKSADENEMDLLCFRCMPGAGQMTVFADSKSGSVVGNFKMNYFLG